MSIEFPTPSPSLLDRINAKRAELEAARAAFAKDMQESMKGVFAGFFAKHSAATAIMWRQYAPHFNDGDPCEFSVHDPEIFFEGDEVDTSYPEGLCPWSLKREIGKTTEGGAFVTQEMYDDFYAIAVLLQSDDDTMRSIFGTDSQVTVTREGIEVEEYDHD